MWDRWDYIKEAEKHLRDKTVDEEINNSKRFFLRWSTQVINTLINLTALVKFQCLTIMEMNYFTYEYKKACNLGRLRLLLKVHNMYRS